MTKPYLAPTAARLAIAGGVSIAFGIVALLALSLDGWKFLRVHPEVKIFHDLRTLTATAGCVNADPEWSMQSAPCSSLGTEYNYPSLPARVLAIFGVDEASTFSVGIALLVLIVVAWFVLVFLVLGSPIQPWRLLVLGLGIFSPPSFLAVERGNYDIVILFLVVCASSLFISRLRKSASVVLAVSTGLKMFSFGAFVMLLRDKKQRFVTLGIFLALSAVLVGASWRELFFVSQRTPTTTTQSFGAALLPLSVYERYPGIPVISGLDRTLSIRVTGVIVFLIVFGSLMIALQSSKFSKLGQGTRDLWSAVFRRRTASTLFLGGAGTLIGAYLLGTNFNYRLIFMVPILASLTMLPAGTGKVLLIVAVTTVYVGTWGPAHLHWFSDLSMLFLVPFLLVGLFSVSALGPLKSNFCLQGNEDSDVGKCPAE